MRPVDVEIWNLEAWGMYKKHEHQPQPEHHEQQAVSGLVPKAKPGV